MLHLRHSITTCLALSIALTTLPPASASQARSRYSQSIGNFALLDQEGKQHTLNYYCKDPAIKAIVLFIHGNGCPLVRKRVSDLKELRKQFSNRGVLFLLLNANSQDSQEEIRQEAEEFGLDFPILKDETQLVVDMLRVNRTAEALLIDPKTATIAFRGPIDDSMDYQSTKPRARKTYLRDSIEALLHGKEILVTKIPSPGCRISLFQPDPDKISYSKDVAPILKNRCIQCHTKGGVAPFAMSSYKKVRGWSDMMEEVVLTRQMPPWHADPRHGRYANESGIPPDEAATLIRWIRAGSKRGEGADPLEGYSPKTRAWALGTPDRVIDIPEQDIPATGLVDYRYIYLKSPFDRDVWISAAEILPGNTRVLHHTIVTTVPPGSEGNNRIEGEWITGYAPGTDAAHSPEDTGMLLRKDHLLLFELHYTVSGKPEVDATKIGFFVLKEAPKATLKTGIIVHDQFEIPPHVQEHKERSVQKIEQNIRVYSLNPHMHLRGKWMNFEAQYPDGKTRMLLSVPNYNFNWQRTYILDQPVDLPAGSRIIVRNAWDNSTLNPNNPDPAATVTWGDQSIEEMFFATFTYRKL